MKLESNNREMKLHRFSDSLLHIPEIGALIPLIVLLVIVGILAPVVFTPMNIFTILRKTTYFGIIALGVTLVIIVGAIDISVGQVAALGACVSAILMRKAVPIPLSIAIALLCTGSVGFLNGFLVAKMKMNGFIVTIGTYYISKGLIFMMTKGYPIYPLPESFQDFGAAEPLGISYSFFLFVILVAVFEFITRRTAYGRKVFACGNNEEVALLAGINVTLVKLSTFVITGLLAGLSGVLLAARISSAMPTLGDGWELQIIAATAIGGISLSGGAGSMIGTFLGILIMAVLTNSLILLGINPQFQTIIIGIIMILAVLVDIIRRNSKLKIG